MWVLVLNLPLTCFLTWTKITESYCNLRFLLRKRAFGFLIFLLYSSGSQCVCVCVYGGGNGQQCHPVPFLPPQDICKKFLVLTTQKHYCIFWVKMLLTMLKYTEQLLQQRIIQSPKAIVLSLRSPALEHIFISIFREIPLFSFIQILSSKAQLQSGAFFVHSN